jgi:hypothetical protein
MVDELHMKKNNKPLAIALSGAGMGIKGRDEGCNVMNIQYMFNWNFHYEFPLYNEYILI